MPKSKREIALWVKPAFPRLINQEVVMPPKDIETIIMEILASSQLIADSGNHPEDSGLRPANRRQTFIARSRKRRRRKNPLYASLRLIILGLVILLVPLLFSVKKVPPPSSAITGAITPVQTAAVPPA